MSKYNLCIENVSVEAVFNKLGGIEGAKRFLRGDLELKAVARSWTEEDSIIYFDVTSDGTTGPEWEKKLEEAGYGISDWARQLLRSPDFKPTTGVTTKVAAIRGKFWKKDSEFLTRNIRKEAESRKWATPNAELACLLRVKFTDEQLKQMGLWYIVAMHEPIKDSDGCPLLLRARRRDDGPWLGANCDYPDAGWSDGGAFAFSVEQVSS